MHHVSETPAVPPVQVFDKTMVVKQVHVLEPQDLLITRADKGTPSPCSTSQTSSPCLHPMSSPLSFFISKVFTAHLLSHYSHSSLSYSVSFISLCVVEYILTLSTSVGPVNTLISGCDLRRLTYREPIPVEAVCICLSCRTG